MEIPLFILALVAAFIYTLVASIRNSSRIKSLEREVHSLKRLMAAGVAAPAAALAENAETAEKTDFAAETEGQTALEPAGIRDEDAFERSEASTAAADQDVAREDAPAAPLADAVSVAASDNASAPAAKESFESLLGARWAVWAGGLALALGGIEHPGA